MMQVENVLEISHSDMISNEQTEFSNDEIEFSIDQTINNNIVTIIPDVQVIFFFIKKNNIFFLF